MPHRDEYDGLDTDEADPTRVTATGDTTTRTTSVYTPYQRVVVTTSNDTTIPLDGVDVDVELTHRTSGAKRWAVATYDLDSATWEALQQGTSVKLTLGWHNGPQRVVATGPIEVMRPQPWQGTTRYIMRGTTHGGARLGKRVSRTWRNEPPHQIARDIAHIANLDVGHITTETDRPGGNWAMTSARPLRQWLDELTKEAARTTDREWTWYTHDEQLFFVPRGTATGPEVALDHDEADGRGRYPSRNAHGSPTDPSIFDRRFDRQLDPEVRRGRAVPAAGTGASDTDPGTYVVGPYQFESSSRTGRHFMHGTLVPSWGSFTPEFATPDDPAPAVAPEEPDHR